MRPAINGPAAAPRMLNIPASPESEPNRRDPSDSAITSGTRVSGAPTAMPYSTTNAAASPARRARIRHVMPDAATTKVEEGPPRADPVRERVGRYLAVVTRGGSG